MWANKSVLFMILFLFEFSIENKVKNPYELTPKPQKLTREFMYPYFDEDEEKNDYQAEIRDSSPQLQKDLGFFLPFLGVGYNYTRVSLSGMLEFSDAPDHVDYPQVYPVKNWPEEKDPAFIGIFKMASRIGELHPEDLDQRRSGVYFRSEPDLGRRTDQFGVELRERLHVDIRDGMIGADNFLPEHAIIATWKNVSFAGGITQSREVTNTFQIVIATDHTDTYAIFNYLDINWTSATEAGGDTLLGRGGVPAFVGFNAGNGTGSYEYLPFSQRSSIVDLIHEGFVNNFRGRHIFKISETVSLGNCQLLDGVNLPLTVAPERGNMLGGTAVNITGPCFQATDEITCSFGGIISNGTVIAINRAICIQPLLKSTGSTRLVVRVNNSTVKWTGKYYVEPPSVTHSSESIYFENDSYNNINASQITIEWDRTLKGLSTDNVVIHISLWGYREIANNSEFVYINELATGVQNTGYYHIIPSIYRNRNDSNVQDIQFGFIQINTTVSLVNGDKITPSIWSKPIPLSWYFNPQWERNFGAEWPQVICDKWSESDQKLQNFTQDLPKCPCTLQQALNDKGRFMPDPFCDKDSNPLCYFHQQAVHCVRTRPNQYGSAQQCCYDRNHQLMLSQDQFDGSSPERSHDFASDLAENQVPTLSNWYHDLVPKYVCCLWQEKDSAGCLSLREDTRPSDSCVDYEGPGIGAVYGDPHIVTFDDLEYDFDGLGEFVLVRSVDSSTRLDIQGRFELVSEKTTCLTSVVVRGNSSTLIEVRKPTLPQNHRKLEVLVSGQRINFEEIRFQNYPDVTVYSPTYIFNQSEVLILLDDGVGVEVKEINGHLSAQVFLPRTYMNKTRGLLGIFTGEGLGDFVLPDGSAVMIDSPLTQCEQIYLDFGLQWIVDDTDDPLKGRSLFWREYGRTADHYNDVTFRPEFRRDLNELLPGNETDFISEILELCTEENHPCKFDFAISRDRNVALATIGVRKYILQDHKEVSRTKVVSCGILKTPRFGRKSTFSFLVGAEVHFDCYSGYVLEGDSQRKCLPDGNWSELQVGVTKCVLEREN